MKFALMSDIHGNLEAFKRAVADAKKRKCKKIICLGDLTGYGKQSKACIEYAMRNVECGYVPHGQPRQRMLRN